MMSTLPVVSARPSKLRILCLNDILNGDLCKKNIFYFHIDLFFWFSNMILKDALILHVSQLQTASDDVTNEVTHIILKTDLLQSFTHFVVDIYEKFSLNDDFQCDLMMIPDSGLLFWATLYTTTLISETCTN